MKLQGFSVGDWIQRLGGGQRLAVDPPLREEIAGVQTLGDARFLCSPVETRDSLVGFSLPVVAGNFLGFLIFGPYPFEIRHFQFFNNLGLSAAIQPDYKWTIMDPQTIAGGFTEGLSATVVSNNPARLPSRIRTGRFGPNAAGVLASSNIYAFGGKIMGATGGTDPTAMALAAPIHHGPIYIPPGQAIVFEGSLATQSIIAYFLITEYEKQPPPIR